MPRTNGLYFQDDKIDGIITLTAFGCGPDSLMVEELVFEEGRAERGR